MTTPAQLVEQWNNTADEIDIIAPLDVHEVEQAATASALRACAGQLAETIREPR